jgi:hypothetical protein
MGIFKRTENDIIGQWGARLFLQSTAKDIYGDGPVVSYYEHVTKENELVLIKTFGKPDVQQTLMVLQQHVLKELAFPLVTSNRSDQEEAVLAFAYALLHRTAQTFTGSTHREDPTGIEMGLCLIIGESLSRCSTLKMRDKYPEVVGEGLLSLSAWMLNFDNGDAKR